MNHDDEARLKESVAIAAPVARVWALVSDICRMPEWSPQVDATRLCDGYASVGPGVRFDNWNSHEELRWETHGEIVRFEPEQEIAFCIDENWVVWSFRLEPDDRGGTRLVQRRETPDGISDYSLRLIDTYMGGQEAFTTTMRAGMRETLERIRITAERG